MAHPQGSTGRVQRLTSLVAMLAVAVAIALAFGRVFDGGGITGTLLITGVATALLAWALERRSLLVTTLAEVALLLVLLGILVFRETTWWLLPGLDTLRAIGEAVGQVGEQARLQVAPAPPVVPLVFATIAAVWAAVFSCHALAFRAASPMLALIPPAALIVFADSVLDDLIRPIYGLWLLVAALAVLFADSLRRMQGWGPIWGGPGRSDRLVPGAGRNARKVAGAAIAVAIIAPFLVPGFGGRAVFDISSIGRDDGVALSALVSMASQLNSGEPKDVFEVQADVASYWRMTALEEFDGVTWVPSEATTVPVEPGAPLPGLTEGETTTQTFTLSEDMLFPWLPTTYRPITVDIPGEASWNPDTETVLVDAPLREGDVYTVTSTYVAPTPEDLAVGQIADGTDPVLVALPPETPATVGELARSWTADAENDYQAIMAIQGRLTGSEFQYETDVAYREDINTIVDFLTVSRRGFCQQFATAMAMLLRSIGIPARVAVGFTDGDPLPGEERWQVSTEDYHAWVEVPFEGYGWLAFEPTKGRTNPLGAIYNDPETIECGRFCERPDGGPGDDVASDNPNEPVPEFSNVGDGFIGDLTPLSTGERWLRTFGPWLAGVAILGVLVWLGLRWRRRRAALALAQTAPREAIVSTYRTFAKRAGAAGALRLSGETPEEYAERLGEVLEDPAPLTRLTRITTAAAYGPRDPSTDDALDAIADANDAVRAVRRLGRRGRSLVATGASTPD